jgi:hypothetical protein
LKTLQANLEASKYFEGHLEYAGEEHKLNQKAMKIGTYQEFNSFNNVVGVFSVTRRNSISASSLQSWLYTALVYTAMTDYPNPSNFLNPMPAYPVKEVLFIASLLLRLYILMLSLIFWHSLFFKI